LFCNFNMLAAGAMIVKYIEKVSSLRMYFLKTKGLLNCQRAS